MSSEEHEDGQNAAMRALRNTRDLAKRIAAFAHSTRADTGFGDEDVDDFEASSAKFANDQAEARRQAERQKAEDAEFVVIPEPQEPSVSTPGGVPPIGGWTSADPARRAERNSRDLVGAWLKQVEIWESGPDFVNDADRVDRVKGERLRLAAEISEQPHLIADPRLREKRRYLTSDIAYNDRPDASSEDYGEFARRRAELRDDIFQGRDMEGPEDYILFAKRTQSMILEPNPSKKAIQDQYDLIDLRREAALEHYDDHRFIVAVARHKAGMFDELLVDFDRRDLLHGNMTNETVERTKALSGVFGDAAKKCTEIPEGQDVSKKVDNFLQLREVGRNIRHNPRAIVNFAGAFDEGSKEYQLGMAALDEVKYDKSLYLNWIEKLSPEERLTIGKKNQTAGAFLVAQNKFQRQFDAGDPGAATSFAIMEQAASRILARPDLQDRLGEIGDLDAIASLHMFSERNLAKKIDPVSRVIDEQVIQRMGDSVTRFGERQGSTIGQQEDGTSYNLDLAAGRVALVLGAARAHVNEIGDPFLSHALDNAQTALSEDGAGGSHKHVRELLKFKDMDKPEYSGIKNLLSHDVSGLSNDDFRKFLADSVASAGGEQAQQLASKMRGRDSVSGLAEELGVSVMDCEPSFEVVDGAHLRVANNQRDLKNGKGLLMRLDGIIAPPPGTQTKNGKFDAGEDARGHLEEVLQRHGVGSLGFNILQLETGESVLEARLSTGEDLSQRMLTDGFALPSNDGANLLRREAMAKQMHVHRKGLHLDGFPEMEQGWRREKGVPEMTWRDTRLNLAKTVASSMAASGPAVIRHLGISKKKSTYGMLSQSEQKLFALPLLNWSGEAIIDRQIRKVAEASPARLQDIYRNNMEILGDLRKRKDKLSQDEKVAHDRLTLGSRALGKVLVEKNLLDGKEYRKDDDDLMSRRGLEMTKNGIRVVSETGLDAARLSVNTAKSAASIGSKTFNYVLGAAQGLE